MEQLSNNDVAPKLYESAEKLLKRGMALDPQIKNIKNKLKNKSATQSDAWKYADRVAHHAAVALKTILTPSNLPDGVLYWNVAERTVKPILELAYNVIASMTASVQEIVWKKQGIGLKPKVVTLSEDRINAFLNKLVSVGGVDDEE